MTTQDKEFYDALLEMFTNSKGWKYFIEEIEKYRKAAQESWPSVGKSDEFFILKGNLQTLTYITNFEEMVRLHLDEEDNADL